MPANNQIVLTTNITTVLQFYHNLLTYAVLMLYFNRQFDLIRCLMTNQIQLKPLTRRVTISDVARKVGVSRSTVSHALSGKRPITEEVRHRVQEAIRELGYQPSFAARSLVLKKTGMIGVLVQEIQNPYTGIVLDALESELVRHQYKVLLGLSNGNQARIDSYINEFGSGMVDGLVNLEPQLDPVDLTQRMPHIPVVTFMRSAFAAPRKVLDFSAGVEDAMKHLWLLGHRKIGFIAGPQRDASARNRLEGYRRFYLGQHAEIHPDWVQQGDWCIESGERLIWPIIAAGCTAIAASNDIMAIGAIRALRARNMNVPRDVSVVGFDDSPLAALIDPPLTTVQVPVRELVRATVNELMDRIAGRPQPQSEVIFPSLIVRSSTAPVQPAGTI